MKWFLLPGIALVALSSLIAMVFKGLEHSAATEPSVAPGPDYHSLIQGTNVHVNIAGQKPRSSHMTKLAYHKSDMHRDAHMPWMAFYGEHIRHVTHVVRNAMKSLSLSTLTLGVHRVATNNAVTTSIIVILVLCALLILFMSFLPYLSRTGDRSRMASPDSVNKDMTSPFARHTAAPGFLQEVLPPARTASSLRSDGRQSLGQLYNSRNAPHQQDDRGAFGLRPWSPLPASPFASLAQMPSSSMAPQFPQQQEEPVFQSAAAAVDKRLPPPLCPNVVLPNCEVRVGVPMHELGKISSEGELTVVGLSGNPLLRAALRKSEAGRTLEISMPEPRSAPRAVVGPSFQEVVGPNKQKSRAVQICGMKGAFYGMLEMRSSGACYVLKDGQTVLIIDGDSESLQLAIKSGQGAPLAAVTCSSEPFGGAEHLEIRVQPGVDTVLVLACVLAVVLLSPYPPSD